MQADQLQELATNAQLNHWPPHLGVRTDAEKIEYLAQRLRDAADAETRAGELSDQIQAAQEENRGLENENDDLQRQIDHLKSDIKALEAKMASIREIVT